jgi:hypothetical protein
MGMGRSRRGCPRNFGMVSDELCAMRAGTQVYRVFFSVAPYQEVMHPEGVGGERRHAPHPARASEGAGCLSLSLLLRLLEMDEVHDDVSRAAKNETQQEICVERQKVLRVAHACACVFRTGACRRRRGVRRAKF